MINYVNTKEVQALKPITATLAKEYSKKNNWLTMKEQDAKFLRMIRNQLHDSEFSPTRRMPPPDRPGPGRPGSRKQPPERDSVDFNRPTKKEMFERRPPPHELEPEGQAFYALLDSNKNVIVGKYLDHQEYTHTPIMLKNTLVGHLAISKRNQLTQGYEIDFIEKQQTYLWIIALVAMCFVALATLPLSRHLVEPIRLISRKMHKLTQGDYQQSIPIKRQDELGQVARDFNELALTLAENETARKRWLANISHELRTPVAILRGELEAMLDEVRPLSKENISSATEEVKHLQRLIDDLNLLTSADIGGMSYRKQAEDLTQILLSEEHKYRTYLANTGIKFILDIPKQEIDVYVDKTRLHQLFENVINNCIKYSSATEFKISLDVAKSNNEPMVILTFEDNGIGVEDSHLEHLFEHLYRVDESRNRKTGGAGLGLSICRLIVTAHQCEIYAELSSSGGLSIIVKLPICLI
jgi:two-component system sensor histidine kinase BaeS